MTAAPILRRSSIEPLESRIAPALLVNGANLLGAGGPTTGETSVGDHSVLLVKVLSGQALVWFDGVDITGISVGPNVRLEVSGDIGKRYIDANGGPQFVPGDIIANLTADGQLTDSDGNPANGDDGGILLPNDILGIKLRPQGGVGGSLGNIVTGGAINNVDLSGTVNGVYAGDGVFRTESFLGGTGSFSSTVALSIPGSPSGFDVNPVLPGQQSGFTLAKTDAHFKSGASINGVKLDSAESLQLFAGNGSPDGSVATGTAVGGGDIANFSINLATVKAGAPIGTPSYELLAGNGGSGKVGGTGGTIINVVELNSSGPVVMQAGQGGAGVGGAGGAGGSIVNLDVQSAGAQYSVLSGDGGQGTPGGTGGRITNTNFTNRNLSAAPLVTADFNGDGFDDVLVADPGTALMVLNLSNGAAGGFTQVAQDGADVLIPGAAKNPVDALATDFNGDGKTDVVVLYHDGTIAAYVNDGNGVFHDPGTGALAVYKGALGFTPAKFSETFSGSGTYGISENRDGLGFLHGMNFYLSGNELHTLVYTSALQFSRSIVDVANDYVGLGDGAIAQYRVTFVSNQPALEVAQSIAAVTSGGLDDLDVDADHLHLLALSAAGKALTVYDISGSPASARLPVTSLASITGKATQAKFVDDHDSNTDDSIVVLSRSTDGVEFTVVTPPGTNNPTGPYSVGASFQTTTLLKGFAPLFVPGTNEVDVVALAGTLTKFTEIDDLASTQDFPLPFAAKQVTLTSGHGGLGVDVAKKLGAGGAGGGIANTNIDASLISLTTGKGGDSNNGPAGAGGSAGNALAPIVIKDAKGAVISTAGGFKSAGGALVVPKLLAELSFKITLGDGGTPMGAGGKSAAGGAGGGVNALDITLASGDIKLDTGKGGDGNGGNGGAGGDATRLVVHALQGGLQLKTGAGGNATALGGNGGAGGSINSLSYTLDLDSDSETVEDPYSVAATTGIGGTALAGSGGASGSINGVVLSLDGPDETIPDSTTTPPVVDPHRDSTVTVTFTTGRAGDGVKGGGAGGSIRNLVSDSVFDQTFKSFVVVNYVTMGLFAGDGGDSSAGNGGAGGSIALSKPISGITEFDPDKTGYDITAPVLELKGGKGGNGGLAGGDGGSVSGLTAQESTFVDGGLFTRTHLFSALLTGGNGGNGVAGNGGAGGGVSNALVGVNGGYLNLFGGTGGTSANAKGGAGGALTGDELGLVSSEFFVGMDAEGGGGGAGKTAGGAGGALSGLRINTPQSTSNYSAVLFSGDGGSASSATGVGGKGGDVNGISQAKDYNSSINVIQAGNGGANLLGKGGAGGNVMNVRTVGFVGRPSDSAGHQLGVFDGSLAQGMFSGRGGDGATDGVNGSISNIVARQIAAMSAAVDSGTGLFAAATKISNVKAALVGFDANGNGLFDTAGAVGATPSATVPVDGFILAKALSQIVVTRMPFVFMA